MFKKLKRLTSRSKRTASDANLKIFAERSRKKEREIQVQKEYSSHNVDISILLGKMLHILYTYLKYNIVHII